MPNKSYPIAKGIALRAPNGGFRCVAGIVVEAQSQEPRDVIVHELDGSMGVLSAILDSEYGRTNTQEALDAWCASIEKDHGVICRGVTAAGFCGYQYTTNSRLFKEGMAYV